MSVAQKAFKWAKLNILIVHFCLLLSGFIATAHTSLTVYRPVLMICNVMDSTGIFSHISDINVTSIDLSTIMYLSGIQ